MRQIAFIAFILLTSQTISLAQKIEGKVTDSLSKNIFSASVNLIRSSGTIISYAVTDENGRFNLTLPANTDTTNLMFRISCIGYKPILRKMSGFENFYNFKLTEDAYHLQEVSITKVKSGISLNGDTVDYLVSKFSTEQDMVIGDVLKRMPGIKVDANGKISFNGKQISSFYIEGDDLLDDRYNIATRSIPASAVEKIQILQNHQAIKMLQGKELSDKLVLNLKLKDNSKVQLLGQAKAALGTPEKYDGDLNLMMFKNKFKAINSIKANNIGNDVSSDIISHKTNDERPTMFGDPVDQLSIGSTGDPNLPSERFLFNKVTLLNINNLIKWGEDIQFKFNVSYLNDTQSRKNESETIVQLPQSLISYNETQVTKARLDLVHLQANLNINKKNIYLNNTLKSDFNRNIGRSTLAANNRVTDQNLSNLPASLSNEINHMTILNSGLILNSYSQISIYKAPEILSITPAPSASIFNNGMPYSNVEQSVSIPTLNFNNNITFKYPIKGVMIDFKTGLNFQQQNYNSTLSFLPYGSSIRVNFPNGLNDVYWRQTKAYLEPRLQIAGKKLIVDLELPIFFQTTKFSQRTNNVETTNSQVFSTPKVSLRYKLDVQKSVELTYRLSNDFGEVSDLFSGQVLTDYRTLISNSGIQNQRTAHMTNLNYKMSKVEKLFFMSVDLQLLLSRSNIISSNTTDTNFLSQEMLPVENNNRNISIYTYFSKYLFPLSSTLTASPFFSSFSQNILQNGVFLPIKTNVAGLGLGVETKINDKISFNYNGKFSNVDISKDLFNRQISHKFAVNYIPLKNLFFKLSSERGNIKQSNVEEQFYTFVDLSNRYQFNKKKFEIELRANNILNTKTFVYSNQLQNTTTFNTYTIPGRIFLLSFLFNF
ncbi:hypothetical protein [Pedobacter cryotolerans]|uniref:TonB-dependent receptor n=1 Tax=Pedobacter cryotolerans TaxID=2571270 RepID=A0A4U1C2B8_9SPHI|nr:hypothetical protein [Pedobacter cryotolerans]TKB97257.1 hypothetical protein FA045_17020 [Pedobacter cryotolerans]